MFKIVKKLKTFNLILKACKTTPNDYSLGYKVRRIVESFQEGKEIKEEIFKETPKP